MLRLVLLVLYLVAASSAMPHAPQSGDPSGLQPPPLTADSGAGNDPDG